MSSHNRRMTIRCGRGRRLHRQWLLILCMALVLLVGFAVAELTLQEWQVRLPRSTMQADDGADDGYEPSRDAQLPPPSGAQRRQPWSERDNGPQGRD